MKAFKYRIEVNHHGGILTELKKEYSSTGDLLKALNMIDFRNRFGYCSARVNVYLEENFVCSSDIEV